MQEQSEVKTLERIRIKYGIVPKPQKGGGRKERKSKTREEKSLLSSRVNGEAALVLLLARIGKFSITGKLT